MPEQFDFVSIKKKANVHFNGTSISHILVLKDGTKKTLGVILPSEEPLTFKTHLAERIEIISGQCSVLIGDDSEIQIYTSGESFQIPANSQFKIHTSEIVDYVCHFE
ncbi:pyrimidine/purine nucleoside phosphorylase [Acinetobacter gyllenbergii]|uniref:pyrimidine/purine nucleoside phosphorylase n=1 Tax=Acinetobacter gyllenbergii TaxID=134534 RepID=UPI0021D05DE2|nr:pyrimidine/purine nucleoside phosphorylase [Acinetobacter gyllenbergii]MCU4582487.1 pyrimidine/purine nucleoside phosphorylase [Acinetobacter gyllenbergii]